ncbi:hypothetical protein HYH39_02170 [Clostridium botulinum]|nr:hypothetical protein KU40_17160 [Clostridium botulinum]MBY6778079.1 hypothetical protein [Clostridium botulinum]MBY6850933.1 hypothetical protein [Clostridium botulinum]NFF25129.1 hypothetical protein [Clostridium botulinum]NFI50054.1 hypothetical protein [Clostridium botulinum]
MCTLNINSIKTNLLHENNLKTLIMSVDFFISLEPNNIDKAIVVIDKLKACQINFNLDDFNIFINSLATFKNYLLGNLVVEPSDSAFIENNKNRIPIINNLLSSVKTDLLANGYNFKF